MRKRKKCIFRAIALPAKRIPFKISNVRNCSNWIQIHDIIHRFMESLARLSKLCTNTPRCPFFVRGYLEILKPDMDTFCQREWQEQISKQNAFFIFLVFSLALFKFHHKKIKLFLEIFAMSDGKKNFHMNNFFVVRR